MRSQNEIWYNTFIIVSEPGDLTRYEYMVYRDGTDDFCFMPTKNNFRFPQRLSYYTVKDLPTSIQEWDTDPMLKIAIMELAEEEHCKVPTLLECIRTANILHERPMK